MELTERDIDRITDRFMQKLKLSGILPNFNEQAQIEATRKTLLRKKWLKMAEVTEGKFWGDIKIRQVINIAKSETGRMELRTNQNGKKPYLEVCIEAVKRIGRERNTL